MKAQGWPRLHSETLPQKVKKILYWSYILVKEWTIKICKLVNYTQCRLRVSIEKMEQGRRIWELA
jgi:hypothetical protein